jgi:hypothetical protein
MNTSKGLAIIGWFLLCGMAALVLYNELLLFKSMPTNGAFQLFNPLKRLADGDVLGRDFDYFHGPGALWAHYPVFALFGGDLWASEVSRKFMSLLAFAVCFVACAAAWRIPCYFAAFAACGVLVAGETFLLGSGAISGGSEVGLRSTLPALALPLIVLAARRFPSVGIPKVFHSLLGALLGTSFFIATEQGLAAIGVYGLVLLALPLAGKGMLARLAWPVWMGIVAILVYLLLATAASGGQPGRILDYALKDLPGEQFWYFGAPPNPIPRFPAIFWHTKILIGFWLPAVLALVEIFRLRIRRKSDAKVPMDSLIVFALLGMSMVVQILHLASYSHYQSISTRNCGLVAMLWLFRLTTEHPRSEPSFLSQLHVLRLPKWIVAGSIGTVAVVLILLGIRLQSKRERESSGVRHAGMTLSKDWASDLSVWESLGARGSSVAGTYRSLIDDIERTSFRGPDYIIHALGSRRAQFLQSLQQAAPDYFHTLHPAFSEYEAWIQLRHWDVYRHLIQFYQPVSASEYHVFWRRKNQPRIPEALSGNLEAIEKDGEWATPANSGRSCVYTTRVRYSVVNPLGRIPLAGKLPRFLLARNVVTAESRVSQIPASLPPGEQEWEFPMILQTGESARFCLGLKLAWPGVSARIESIELEPVCTDPAVIEGLSGPGELLNASRVTEAEAERPVDQ